MKETFWKFGPISFLKVGVVWSLDLFDRVGLYGIGWRHIAARRVIAK